MRWTIDDRFKIADNTAVVDCIVQHTNLSAHDEAVDALTQSAQGLSDLS